MIEFTKRNVNRTLLFLAWPVILENLLNMGIFWVDSIFIGQLGTDAFAAFGQTSMLLYTITFALSGVGIAAGAMVARYIGQKKIEMAREAAGQGLLLGGLVGVILTVAGLAYSRDLLVLLDTPVEMIDPGVRYLHLVLYFGVFRLLSFVGAGILRAAGDTRTPMWATAVMNIFNAVGDWVLIFGYGPFPEMGLDGAALATGLSFVVSTIIILLVLFKKKPSFYLTPSHVYSIKPAIQKTIVRITVPHVCEQFLYQGAYWIFLWMVTSLGTTAVAAHFMAIRVESLSYMPAHGLAIAVSTLVGQSLGARRVDLAELVVRRSMIFGMGFMTILGIIFVAAPGILVSPFSPSPEVFPLACLCVQIAALELPGDILLMMCVSAMRGAGDTVTPMIISFLGAFVMRIGVIYLLVMVWDLGLPGVWYGTAIDFTIRGLVGYALYRRGRWKRIEL